MKKIWIIFGVIVVLVAAWLGASWYTGTLIEAQTGNILARMNASLAKNQRAVGTQIKQISYERGLLSSHARFAVTSALLGDEPLAESDLTFSHGPFPLAALQQGKLEPLQYQGHIDVLATAGPVKMMVGALMNGRPPLSMDFGCSYGNHCTGTGGMPPIDVDLGAISKNAKLAFGGVRMRFDFSRESDTDYNTSGDLQLLPLSIGGQDFGSGQITMTGDAQSATETFSWKTDQGASKLAIALAATRPMSMWGDDASLTPEDLPKLLKTASAKLELSKPMVIDLAARALSLTKGGDLAAARQQIATQFDTLLAGNPQTEKFIHTEGDLLVSDWQYADGKLTINGQENTELLEQIKQSYLAQLHAQRQSLPAEGGAAAPSSGNKDVVRAPSEGVVRAPSDAVVRAPSEGVVRAPSDAVVRAPSDAVVRAPPASTADETASGR